MCIAIKNIHIFYIFYRFTTIQRVFLVCILCAFLQKKLKAQQNYFHKIVWGRLALNDTINSKLRWEMFIQHRRQNALDSELDVLRSPQFTSYWAWLNYSLSPRTKLSISPFGYGTRQKYKNESGLHLRDSAA